MVEAALRDHPEGTELDADAAATLLAAYGIAVAPSWTVHSADEAMDGAAAIGFPVALKAAEAAHFAPAHAGRGGARRGRSLAPGPAVVQPMVAAGVDTVDRA